MAWAKTQGTNIEQPMEEKEVLFIYDEDKAIAERYAFDPAYGGKWILILPNRFMNNTWAECCSLYRKGQLKGITFIKSSTSAYNPRQINSEAGVIMFHCGPSNDKEKMMSYGQNIIHKLKCFSPFGCLPYKSDAQSQKGTRATGNNDNSLYSIALPRQPFNQFSETGRPGDSCVPPNQGSGAVSTNARPSAEFQVFWLHERKPEICAKYNHNLDESGHWLMVFSKMWLDKNWQKACKMYRENELTGIHSLCVSTAKHRSNAYEETGIIMFYCGPSHDPALIRSYGENLVNLMGYLEKDGHMTYWVDNPRRVHLHIEVPSPWRRRDSKLDRL